MVFIRLNINIDMHEYEHSVVNILKRKFRVNITQFNYVCVYRSPSGDLN
jgi:hypothetical protein